MSDDGIRELIEGALSVGLHQTADAMRELLRLRQEVATLRAERDKLARFKAWVHGYLDGRGIPHHPPGTHGTEGCRIGDRMDYVWAEIDRLRAERDAAVAAERERCAALVMTPPDLSALGMPREYGPWHANQYLADAIRRGE